MTTPRRRRITIHHQRPIKRRAPPTRHQRRIHRDTHTLRRQHLHHERHIQLPLILPSRGQPPPQYHLSPPTTRQPLSPQLQRHSSTDHRRIHAQDRHSIHRINPPTP